jgi:hypothetical protein
MNDMTENAVFDKMMLTQFPFQHLQDYLMENDGDTNNLLNL